MMVEFLVLWTLYTAHGASLQKGTNNETDNPYAFFNL